MYSRPAVLTLWKFNTWYDDKRTKTNPLIYEPCRWKSVINFVSKRELSFTLKIVIKIAPFK